MGNTQQETIDELKVHITSLENEIENAYDLVTLSGIADIDKTTKQNVYRKTLGKTFPKPVLVTGGIRLWKRSDVTKWLEGRYK